MHRIFLWSVGATVLLGVAGSGLQAGEVAWKRVELDPRFRSEGVAVADFDKDGQLDVVAGDVWYAAPDWKVHELRTAKEYDGAKWYSDSFTNYAYDVNADGWQDVILIGFPGEACHWYENPRNKPGHWKQHLLWHSAANESPQFRDVNGDDRPDLVMASEPEGIVGYLEVPSPEKCTDKWTFTAVSEEKIPVGSHRYYHGLGVGDVNGDSRQDILIPHGWWEHPAEAGTAPWKFHPLVLNATGTGDSFKGADMYTDDMDMDGDQDILFSSAHEVGIWYFENTGGNDNPEFKYHLISDLFSQSHALHYADVNGDGTRDLISGKRFYAHGPNGDIDPGAEVVMYWFEVKKTAGQPPQFTPHKISEGSGTGVGTQFQVIDFDGDQKLDIVLSNKKGVNLLLQK